MASKVTLNNPHPILLTEHKLFQFYFTQLEFYPILPNFFYRICGFYPFYPIVPLHLFGRATKPLCLGNGLKWIYDVMPFVCANCSHVMWKETSRVPEAYIARKSFWTLGFLGVSIDSFAYSYAFLGFFNKKICAYKPTSYWQCGN